MFKDTKEGQTHSLNDGCGEPAHNNMEKSKYQVHEIINESSRKTTDGKTLYKALVYIEHIPSVTESEEKCPDSCFSDLEAGETRLWQCEKHKPIANTNEISSKLAVTESEECKHTGTPKDIVGCEVCHPKDKLNPPLPPLPEEKDLVEDWERELIKQIDTNPDFVFYDFDGGLGKDLTNFISKVLSSNTERVKRLAEGMKVEEGQTERCKNILEMNYLIGKNKGYNQALEDIINNIK